MSVDDRKWGWMEIGAEEAFGPFESRAEAEGDARDHFADELENEDVESIAFRVGRCEPVIPADRLTIGVDEVLERMEESACDELALEDTIFSVRGTEGEAQAALNDALDEWCREWVQCEHWTLADTEDVEVTV
jgi:hypothetical protein